MTEYRIVDLTGGWHSAPIFHSITDAARFAKARYWRSRILARSHHWDVIRANSSQVLARIEIIPETETTHQGDT